MQTELVVGLASAGVAALAVAASTVATVLSLRGQRENTKATLEAQRALAAIQEDALRERARWDAVRGERVLLYRSIIIWAEKLLHALSAMNEERPGITPDVWHVDRSDEVDLDLYASDVVHTRFNALRGLLIGLVDGSPFRDSPLVSWTEGSGRIESVSIARTPLLDNWIERERIRDKAHDDSLSLISIIRAEIQGPEHSGYFITYRLDRAQDPNPDQEVKLAG
jgi:hypothetical protein